MIIINTRYLVLNNRNEKTGAGGEPSVMVPTRLCSETATSAKASNAIESTSGLESGFPD